MNLSNFAYTGTDQNLIDLTQHLDGGSLTVNFTFDPARPAGSAGTSTSTTTSFSGTLIAAPLRPRAS